MQAELINGEQIRLPAAVLAKIGHSRSFELSLADGCIILRPAGTSPGNNVREKLKAPGITEQDVEDAVAWARRE